jgi:predicted ester cyclase
MTHTGECMGVPPSGRRVTITGIDICWLQDGKIAERWHQGDVAGLKQLRSPVPAWPARNERM